MIEGSVPQVPEGRQLVQRWTSGGFVVSGRAFAGSVLILAEQTVSWPVAEAAAVTVESLGALEHAEPPVDLLVLGTGERFALPDPALRAVLRSWGIVIEPMSTPAACRTFNLLVAEGRRVAAALVAMPSG